MDVLTDQFLEELAALRWNVDTELGYAFCVWQFQKKWIACMAAQVEDEEDDVIELQYAYCSRYAETPRSRVLFEAYNRQGKPRIVYRNPNRLDFKVRVEALDEDGDEIQPPILTDTADHFALRFFELVSAYEQCARQTEPTTRVPERYRKVLPSRQLAMLATTELSS